MLFSFAIRNPSMPNTITGTLASELLDGSFDDDYFDASGGDDTMLGSYGDDTLVGGDGNDSADYTNIGYTVTLTALNTVVKGGALGTDYLKSVEIVFGSALYGDTIDLSAAISQTGWIVSGATVNLSGASATVNVNGGTSSYGWRVRNFEHVVGTNYNDSITGDGFANNLNGRGGNDLIDGVGGNDLLMGGPGSDTIFGGAGNDTIIGGAGQDKMIGQIGNDRYRWSLTSESPYGTPDYITDFTLGDTLDFGLVDAEVGPGNQTFAWTGIHGTLAAALASLGAVPRRLCCFVDTPNNQIHILGNTNFTFGAELQVVLDGVSSPGALGIPACITL
jgi:Ca2+-binding RTX toxin-like protein